MNKIKVLMLGLLLIIVVQAPTSVLAKTTDQLYYNDKEQDLQFVLTFEEAGVEADIVSPSGHIVSNEDDNVTILYFWLTHFITIEDAEVGLWQIAYDKGSLDLEENVEVYAESDSITITQFNLQQLSANKKEGYTYTYDLYVASERDYDLECDIVLHEEIGGLRKADLGTFEGKTNTLIQGNFSLPDDLATNDYIFRVKATTLGDEVSVADSVYSDPFSHTEDISAYPVDDFYMTVNLNSQIVSIKWDSNNLPEDTATIYVRATADNKELVHTAVDTYDHSAYGFVYPEGANDIYVELFTRNQHQRISMPVGKHIFLDQVIIDLPNTKEVTSYDWSINYSKANSQPVDVTINGNTDTIFFDGSGVKDFTLPDKNNKIDISYTDEDNVTYRLSSNITVQEEESAKTLPDDTSSADNQTQDVHEKQSKPGIIVMAIKERANIIKICIVVVVILIVIGIITLIIKR